MKPEEAKKKLFEVMDKIEAIKNTPFDLTEKEDLELRNLEEQKMRYYSIWKD